MTIQQILIRITIGVNVKNSGKLIAGLERVSPIKHELTHEGILKSRK